ncbi:MAG: tail fiber domain-containing protein [Burkholderiales bacterium]
MRRSLLVAVGLVLGFLAGPSQAGFCPGVSPWVFDDVQDTDPFCGYITEMAVRGVTLGCVIIDPNHRLYCPTPTVRRDQMAAFLSRLATGMYQQGGNAFGSPATLGTKDSQPLVLIAGNQGVMRLAAASSVTYSAANIIGGSPLNSVGAGIVGATVAGGGGNELPSNPLPNNVTGDFGTVGGGLQNTASGFASTVGGGYGNTASGFASTVGGGYGNTASGYASTVGGGVGNQATGLRSTVAGGYGNSASGDNSFAGGDGSSAGGFSSLAAGVGAKASHDGSFVWSGWAIGAASYASSFAANSVRFAGEHGFRVDYYSPNGVGGSGTRWVYFGDLDAGKSINAWNGAYLSDAGVWTNTSDRNLKDDFAAIDARSVLERVVALPIAEWRYKSEPMATRHVGPMAQDFHAAFGLGSDDTHIGTVDESGIALAAIQGLNAKLEAKIAERDARIDAQARRIAELESAHAAELAELKRAVEALLARTSPEGRVAAK